MCKPVTPTDVLSLAIVSGNAVKSIETEKPFGVVHLHTSRSVHYFIKIFDNRRSNASHLRGLSKNASRKRQVQSPAVVYHDVTSMGFRYKSMKEEMRYTSNPHNTFLLFIT